MQYKKRLLKPTESNIHKQKSYKFDLNHLIFLLKKNPIIKDKIGKIGGTPSELLGKKAFKDIPSNKKEVPEDLQKKSDSLEKELFAILSLFPAVDDSRGFLLEAHKKNMIKIIFNYTTQTNNNFFRENALLASERLNKEITPIIEGLNCSFLHWIDWKRTIMNSSNEITSSSLRKELLATVGVKDEKANPISSFFNKGNPFKRKLHDIKIPPITIENNTRR